MKQKTALGPKCPVINKSRNYLMTTYVIVETKYYTSKYNILNLDVFQKLACTNNFQFYFE